MYRMSDFYKLRCEKAWKQLEKNLFIPMKKETNDLRKKSI